MTNPEVTPKEPNPKATDFAQLPKAPDGTAWDVVEVGGIDFAYLAASDLTGVGHLTSGNEPKAAQLFNRALRIDIPAKCDARPRIKTARQNGTLETVVSKLQAEFLAFDVNTIATRAPRTPPTVTAENKAQYSRAEVDAMLANAGIKFVTK